MAIAEPSMVSQVQANREVGAGLTCVARAAGQGAGERSGERLKKFFDERDVTPSSSRNVAREATYLSVRPVYWLLVCL